MIDKIIVEFDKVGKTLFTKANSSRPHPDKNIEETELSDTEKKDIIGLMRINHCGEMCAQGLYLGQSITTREQFNREAFAQAAQEETEHLAWLSHRIKELDGNTSILNPLFYLGSIALGVTAGILGDKWNLGFLEETERQVEAHLEHHLDIIPPQDLKSKAILQQMKTDELGHAEMAHNYGAAELPKPVKLLMKLSSKVMTKATYYF